MDTEKRKRGEMEIKFSDEIFSTVRNEVTSLRISMPMVTTFSTRTYNVYVPTYKNFIKLGLAGKGEEWGKVRITVNVRRVNWKKEKGSFSKRSG